ncbi:hypothetical protein FHG87_015235 [Trinorchestia longiramus]|nr:hypothetical protein FHG87_015235 [Trinorchestia longiramus]
MARRDNWRIAWSVLVMLWVSSHRAESLSASQQQQHDVSTTLQHNQPRDVTVKSTQDGGLTSVKRDLKEGMAAPEDLWTAAIDLQMPTDLRSASKKLKTSTHNQLSPGKFQRSAEENVDQLDGQGISAEDFNAPRNVFSDQSAALEISEQELVPYGRVLTERAGFDSLGNIFRVDSDGLSDGPTLDLRSEGSVEKLPNSSQGENVIHKGDQSADAEIVKTNLRSNFLIEKNSMNSRTRRKDEQVSNVRNIPNVNKQSVLSEVVSSMYLDDIPVSLKTHDDWKLVKRESNNSNSLVVPQFLDPVELSLYGGMDGFDHHPRFARFSDLPADDPDDSDVCHIGIRYPRLSNSSKSILIGVLMTQVGSVRERLGLKIPGAVTYAVNTVNEEGILPDGYQLQFEFNPAAAHVVPAAVHVVPAAVHVVPAAVRVVPAVVHVVPAVVHVVPAVVHVVPAAVHVVPAAVHVVPAVVHVVPAAVHVVPAVVHVVPAVVHVVPAAVRVLSAAVLVVPAVIHVVPAAFHVHSVCCSSCRASCSYGNTSCSLSSTSCNLGSASCNFGSASYNFGSASYNFGSVRCNLGSASCNLGSVRCNLGSVRRNLGGISCNLGSVSCNLGSVRCNLGSVSCNLGSVRRNLGLLSGIIGAKITNDRQAFNMVNVWLIKQVWAITKERVKEVEAGDKGVIKQKWQEINIDKELCKRLIRFIPKRLQAVLGEDETLITKEHYD